MSPSQKIGQKLLDKLEIPKLGAFRPQVGGGLGIQVTKLESPKRRRPHGEQIHEMISARKRKLEELEKERKKARMEQRAKNREEYQSSGGYNSLVGGRLSVPGTREPRKRKDTLTPT